MQKWLRKIPSLKFVLESLTRQQLLRHAASFSILAIFLLNAAEFFEFPFIRGFENQAYDLRLNLTKPDTIDQRVVIVDIDEKSLKGEGRWPWGRNRIADMLDQLFDYYHVSIVGFDVLFAEPDESSGLRLLEKLQTTRLAKDDEYKNALRDIAPELKYDDIFANSMKNRPVVLGYYFKNESTHGEADMRLGALPDPVISEDQAVMKKIPFVTATGYGANLKTLQVAASNAGFIDMPMVDADGIIRRMPLVQKFEGGLYESFSLAMIRTLLDKPPVSFITSTNEASAGSHLGSLEWLDVGGMAIPVDERGGTLIPYRGKFPSFPYVSAIDILNKTASKDTLKDAIILIGTTSAGLLDMRATPVQNIYPGVEVHANMIIGIFDQILKHRPNFVVGGNFLIMLLIGIVINLLYPFLPIFGNLVATAIMTSAVIGANYYFWHFKNVDFPIVAQVLLISVLFIFHLAYGFFVENREKRELTKLFGQYIPPELVEEMSKNPEDYSLGGGTRVMTVMFTDVRNFTSIAEQMNPQQLTMMINEYFTEMTAIIHHHRGTIDKYIGDAIMAFWGAPLHDNEHERHAVQAALAMIQIVEKMQERFRARGWPEISMGIGVNTGRMNVGNMGSKFRMSYTVLGDAVNIGSRLEALTKRYNVPVIVSERTKEQAPEYCFRELDLVRVKGRGKPIRIFQPLGFKAQLSADDLQQLEIYHQALHYYRSQDWESAKNLFQKLIELSRGAMLYQEYLGRIIKYQTNPPPANWNGIYTFSTK